MQPYNYTKTSIHSPVTEIWLFSACYYEQYRYYRIFLISLPRTHICKMPTDKPSFKLQVATHSFKKPKSEVLRMK